MPRKEEKLARKLNKDDESWGKPEPNGLTSVHTKFFFLDPHLFLLNWSLYPDQEKGGSEENIQVSLYCLGMFFSLFKPLLTMSRSHRRQSKPGTSTSQEVSFGPFAHIKTSFLPQKSRAGISGAEGNPMSMAQQTSARPGVDQAM